VRELKPLSFADWEMMQQGVRLEPMLQAIADFLVDHEELIEAVSCDLRAGLKNPDTGRCGLAPEQVLRSLVLMRIKDWDYRELRERIADGYSLRQFTAFHCRPVPRHDAFHRAFVKLTPDTMKAVNDLVVQAAVELELEDGAKLRVDSTVVQTDIHHPTDNTLLWDLVRVVTRLVIRLGKATKPSRIRGFSNRTRAAHRRMYEIQRMTSRQRFTQLGKKYRALIAIAEEVVVSAREALSQTKKAHGKTTPGDIVITQLREEIDYYCSLGDRVIDQTRRRVDEGATVPSAEKLYSVFEPHTDLIKRGKVRTPIEFGHKVFLAESAQGLITQYLVLNGNPSDDIQVSPSLRRHRQAFGRAPALYSSDRGFFSEENLTACARGDVKVVCIPQRGGAKTSERAAFEKSEAFKQGQRFRAGIEGRISVLMRGRGMKRCRAKGPQRFEVFVAAAVLANNLMRIATLLENAGRRRAA